jgi:hypothetical protein
MRINRHEYARSAPHGGRVILAANWLLILIVSHWRLSPGGRAPERVQHPLRDDDPGGARNVVADPLVCNGTVLLQREDLHT